MKTILMFFYLQVVLARQTNKKIICYYDYKNAAIAGLDTFEHCELQNVLRSCTHLVYRYAGFAAYSYRIYSEVDTDIPHYRQILAIKNQLPHLKIYLSLGGDKDYYLPDDKKYILFLESGKVFYHNFIQSSIEFLKQNGFNGLDLAFQFPRNKPRKVHSKLGTIWKGVKKVFTGNFIVDKKAAIHKNMFSDFVNDMHQSYAKENLSMSLTVLPNVNSSWYFDIPQIHNKFEYINLFAFDFLTPERNPYEADYTAPIYLKNSHNRLPHYNIDFQVQHWINNGCPAHKLNLGIPTHARSWKTASHSLIPVISDTTGPASPGSLSQTAGLLSYGEVCSKLLARDCTKTVEFNYGSYAICPANKHSKEGVWISFDSPEFAAWKADYVIKKGVGGVAVVDISYDAFQCAGAKYSISRAVINKLLTTPNSNTLTYF